MTLSDAQRRAMFAKKLGNTPRLNAFQSGLPLVGFKIKHRLIDKSSPGLTRERFDSDRVTSSMQRADLAERQQQFKREQMIRAIKDPESFSFPLGHPSRIPAAKHRMELQEEAARQGLLR